MHSRYTNKLLVFVGAFLLGPLEGAVPPVCDIVEGVVIAGGPRTPIPDVSIELDFGSKTREGITNSNGGFTLSAIFGSYRAITPYVTLTFHKDPYNGVRKVLTTGSSSTCSNLTIEMTKLANAVVGRDDDIVKRFYSEDGRTLFVLPYEMNAGADASRLAPTVNPRHLSQSLHRFINTGLQQLETDKFGSSVPEVSVRSLSDDVPNEFTDEERLRSFGRAINALAIAGGAGEVSAADEVQLSTRYYIVPTIPGQQLGTFYLDDKVALQDLNSIALWQRLSDEWLHYTLLAYCIKQIRVAADEDDVQLRRQVYGLLVAERARLGPEDEARVRTLTKLIKGLEPQLRPGE